MKTKCQPQILSIYHWFKVAVFVSVATLIYLMPSSQFFKEKEYNKVFKENKIVGLQFISSCIKYQWTKMSDEKIGGFTGSETNACTLYWQHILHIRKQRLILKKQANENMQTQN